MGVLSGSDRQAIMQIGCYGAAIALRCYLFAAAVSGHSMADVARWVGNARDHTALEILERHGGTPPGWAGDVRQLVEHARRRPARRSSSRWR
jgi:type IV secretion system protein VirD4